jgi:DNA-binding LacI/PurR family transcriptional regulator
MAHWPRRAQSKKPDVAHRLLAARLRQLISSGQFSANQLLPSLREMCGMFNASFSVVRQAVELLKNERRIVVNARRQLVVDRKADALMDGGGIILAVTSMPLKQLQPNSGYSNVLEGAMLGAGELEAPLMLAHAHAFQNSLPEGFLDYSVRGIVLLGQFTPEILRRYERMKLPVVLADTPADQYKIHSVAVDNAQAAHDTVLKLANDGHRHVAFVRRILLTLKDIDADSKERQTGFQRGLRSAKLRGGGRCIINFLPESRPADRLQGFFEARPKFSAVLCADTMIADILREAAQRNGVRVPEQLSILSFHSSRQANRAGPAIDFVDIGRRAVRLLAQPKGDAVHERVPAVIRASG